jgi:hypothetical protein
MVSRADDALAAAGDSGRGVDVAQPAIATATKAAKPAVVTECRPALDWIIGKIPWGVGADDSAARGLDDHPGAKS